MSLVQIQKRHGVIIDVPRGTTPVVELPLDDNQRVVSIDLNREDCVLATPDRVARPMAYKPLSQVAKTADWSWTAFVETRL